MRRLIAIVAFGLVAAACGGNESSVAFEGPAATAAPSTTDTVPATNDGSSATPVPSDGPTTTVAPPAPTELPESDYPDVLVADLAGGEVNLRELALESEPVLLWFWAPH